MSKSWRIKNIVIGATFATCVSMSTVNAAVIELALVLDGSGSISDSDFALQTQAYNNIFSNNFYSTFVDSGDTLYVGAYEFSTGAQQVIDYTLIDSDEAAATFGGLFLPIQQSDGLTNTAGGVNLAVNDLLNNGIGGGADDILLIDVSTDGLPNIGSPDGITAAIDAAAAAAAAGVTVNAIGVGADVIGESFLDDFSTAGEGFFLTADNFDDFEETLELKLASEINGIDPTDPPPADPPMDPPPADPPMDPPPMDPPMDPPPADPPMDPPPMDPPMDPPPADPPMDPMIPVIPPVDPPMDPPMDPPSDPQDPMVDVPEPASVLLLGMGLLGLGAARRRKKSV